MPNWRQSTKNYKGRVVLRGDVVKDDPGSYAVFTGQSSAASQMTTAKVMDIISRLRGCAGQAADAVSAYTQLKMEDAPKLLKIPKSECPDIWIRLPRHKWPKSCPSMEDPVVLLERKLYGHPLAAPTWERQFEKVLLKYDWEKVSGLMSVRFQRVSPFCRTSQFGSYSEWNVDKTWSSQEWKSDALMEVRKGRPVVTAAAHGPIHC